MQRVVITGGKGFIGSNLIKHLKEEKYKIKILTRGKTFIKDNLEYQNVNYHNIKSTTQALKDCDIIIHLAATLFARSKKEYIKENVITTRNLVESSNLNKIKKFIYISSLAAGGPSIDENKAINEEVKENPVSYYGLSKLLSEKELMNLRNIDYVILRPPIVYGPKDDGFSTIAQWVKKGIMISPSDKSSRFSFIFVEDLCKCIIKAIEDDKIKNDKFYVGEPNIYSWEEFINLMAENMGVKKPKIIKIPISIMKLTALSYELISYLFKTKPILNRDKVREAKAKHWILDPSKWEKKTGFYNWTPLKKGLKKSFSNLV